MQVTAADHDLSPFPAYRSLVEGFFILFPTGVALAGFDR